MTTGGPQKRQVQIVGEWAERAACKTVPYEVMFPQQSRFLHKSIEKAKDAKAICATCPVINECLEHALINEGPVEAFLRNGVMGGMTENEREMEYHRRKLGQTP